MARCIDADELLKKLPDDLPYKASVKRVLIQAPEADVVPKSEVEDWKEIAETYQKMFEDNYSARKDVAREIFEEIKKHLIFNAYGIAIISDKTFAELKKKYTAE